MSFNKKEWTDGYDDYVSDEELYDVIHNPNKFITKSGVIDTSEQEIVKGRHPLPDDLIERIFFNLKNTNEDLFNIGTRTRLKVFLDSFLKESLEN